MRPFDHEQVTSDNVEQKIEQIFASQGQPYGSSSPDARVMQELYTLYRGPEGIKERVWEKLVQQHPEILESVAEEPLPLQQNIVQFPQAPSDPAQLRSRPQRPAKKSWFQRASILLAIAVSLILIAGSILFFGHFLPTPTAHPLPPASGPLQFYDHNGKLFYQIDGKKESYPGTKDPHTVEFVRYAMDELAAKLHVSKARLSTMNIKVTTTLDLALQNTSFQIAQQNIAKNASLHNMHDAAVAVIDYHDGSIRSLFWSLNVVTQEARQPGSVFKPLVYADAFEHGISPGEVVSDEPTSFPPDGYTPLEIGRVYHGPVSYRYALQNSLNIPAVQLYQRLNRITFETDVKALGLAYPDAWGAAASIALGSASESLLMMTGAYGSIANQGVRIPPHAIIKVVDASGNIIYQARTQGHLVFSKATSFMITDVLSDNNARADAFGLCSPLILYTTSQEQCLAGHPGTVRPAAVKSASDGNFKDNWAVGYTPDYVVGAWTGNDNAEPMVNVTGLTGAAEIWHDTMLQAEQGLPINAFSGPPANVVRKTVTSQGLTTTDWYLTH